MAVKARMKVSSITAQPTYVNVVLGAVYSSDPEDPNYSYAQATPSAQLSLNITNPGAFEQFFEGEIYDIDITKYTPPAPVEAAPTEQAATETASTEPAAAPTA